MKEPDWNEVEAAASAVELDSRNDMQEASFGFGPDPGSEMEMCFIGVDQGLAINNPVDGEHRGRVRSPDADQPDQGLSKA